MCMPSDMCSCVLADVFQTNACMRFSYLYFTSPIGLDFEEYEARVCVCACVERGGGRH